MFLFNKEVSRVSQVQPSELLVVLNGGRRDLTWPSFKVVVRLGVVGSDREVVANGSSTGDSGDAAMAVRCGRGGERLQ